MEEERRCRTCYSGERGLADPLIQPCDCRGTQAFVHVSCLHAWRTQQTAQLLDTSRCEVCRAPYRIPPAAWRAHATSGGSFRLRLQTLQQRVAARLGWAARPLLLLTLAVVKARHIWHRLGQSYYLCIPSEKVPLLHGALPSCQQRVAPYAWFTAKWLVSVLLLKRWTAGDWRAVRLLRTWRLAQRMAAVCSVYAAAAALQWACDVRWDAPGAPAKQPLTSKLADAVLRGATVVAAVNLSLLPSLAVALLGPLAPRDLRHQADAGFWLLSLSVTTAAAEGQQQQIAEGISSLLAERPHALAALHAALA